MSEWNRDRRDDTRRDADRDRYGQRSSQWRDERWAGDRQGGETRSFGGAQDYGAGSGQDRVYGGQRENRDFGRQGYGQSGEQSYGRSYGDRSYGQGGRSSAQAWSDTAGRQGDPWRDTWRDEQGQRTPTGGSQAQGGAFAARNELVQHVTDGDADHGMWSMFGRGDHGRGEHRGRGPKNYTRSDDRIREDVNDRLTHDSRLDASEIEVEVSQAEITLTGTVMSREDKRVAEDIAEQVSGVKHVQNNLRVQAQGGASSFGQTGVSATRTDNGRV